MVKHIVLYTLKEGVDKEEAVKLIGSVLEPLVGKIPGLLHLEVCRAFNGMDYALYSEFESREALTAYAADQTDDNWAVVVKNFVDGWASEYALANG